MSGHVVAVCASSIPANRVRHKRGLRFSPLGARDRVKCGGTFGGDDVATAIGRGFGWRQRSLPVTLGLHRHAARRLGLGNETHHDPPAAASWKTKPLGDPGKGEIPAARGHQRHHVEIVTPGAGGHGLQPLMLAPGAARREPPTTIQRLADRFHHAAAISERNENINKPTRARKSPLVAPAGWECLLLVRLFSTPSPPWRRGW